MHKANSLPTVYHFSPFSPTFKGNILTAFPSHVMYFPSTHFSYQPVTVFLSLNKPSLPLAMIIWNGIGVQGFCHHPHLPPNCVCLCTSVQENVPIKTTSNTLCTDMYVGASNTHL